MKKMTLYLTCTGIACLAAVSQGFAQDADTAPASATAGSQEAPQAAPATGAQEQESPVSPIMNEPLHNNEPGSFEAGLAKVRESATKLEVAQLDNALSVLLLYDIAARGKKDKLYERLDGKTPQEIIAMAKRD